MSVAPVDAPVDKVTRLRPGHADLAGAIKYGHDDVRNVLERASARETATRVAAGAVARRLLDEFGVEIHSHTVAIATVEVPESDPGQIDWAAVEDSPVRCADRVSAVGMRILIDAAQAEGDTLGGVFEVVASGLPIGLGSHVHWDRRLDGRLAAALMSIPSAKGVGIGAGFAAARQPGSEVHDVVVGREVGPAGVRYRHRTNRAGGVEGGMTNGEPVVARVALKPIPTLANPLPSLDLHTGETVQAHYERSDVCVVPAAGVVGEAMLALVLAEAWLEKFGGDSLEEVRRNYLGYVGI